MLEQIVSLFFCFCFEVDKTVRGEAGSCWNHSRAHHQNSALPRSASQSAVCGQKRWTKAQSSGKSFSVSCFSIHAVLPACHQALVYGAFTSRGRDGTHPNCGYKCNEENNAVCIDCEYLRAGNFQFHCVFELRGLPWSRKWNVITEELSVRFLCAVFICFVVFPTPQHTNAYKTTLAQTLCISRFVIFVKIYWKDQNQ